jgi:hypothetical protein
MTPWSVFWFVVAVVNVWTAVACVERKEYLPGAVYFAIACGVIYTIFRDMEVG